ncbi:hypothetical protein ABK040_013348 [Willaertia magna]
MIISNRYPNKSKLFFIQLAYSVGSDQYKIRPLLNKGKEQILNAIDQSIYLDCLLSLLVMQGRSRGLRGDTLQAVKLRDITFIRSMVNKFVLLTTRFWIEKDKTVFKRKRYQTLLGNPNYKRCGNICLLLYLTHFRKVFRVNDPIYLLNLPQGHPDWQILDEYLDEPLFLSTDGKNSWSNKCMSNKMKNFCSAHKIELYSTRSLRSGLCCSLLLKYKMLHGELHSSFLEKVKEFIGWESIKEINIYKRFVTDHYSEEGILCESRVSNTMISDILSSVIEEEGCADGLLDFQFSWDGVIPLKNLKVEHLWCNSVRHSNDKFIWHLRIPGSLSCYLQLTCSEKEKRRILEEQEEAKRLKQRYHAYEAEKVYNKYYSNFITRDLDIDARNSEEGKASKSKMKVVLKYAKDKAIRLWDENTVIIYCKENNLYLDKKKWVINQNKKANKKDEYSADYYKEHAKLMEWKQQQLHNVQKEMKEKEKELKLQHLLRSKEEIAKRDDDEMELMEMYTYSALNPESMLTSSNKQDVEDIKEKKESMQKVINYTHDKNFTQQLSKLLLDVLYHVRFPILDPQEVYELIEPSKVVSAELLLEAYRCHALQNRIELLTAPRLKVREGSLFYVSGVVENVQIGKLKGWTLFYHKPYHHPTTEVDLQPAKGTRILVGARHKNSNSLALCAMGRKEKVLKETFENETTKENGCYFYHWKNHSFGFSDTNVVQLGTADLSTDSKLKLSWHLTGRGGYRCGLLTSLNESKEWEKMLFYA